MIRKIIILIYLIVLAKFALAVQVPILENRVNDLAGILSENTAHEINTKLIQIEHEDSTQIVILTINSLDHSNIEDFALKTFNKNKIGQKYLDNGVLLVIALSEREVRIEVGRGLEGKLTDVICSKIIRNILVPNFRNGNFENGIKQSIENIINIVKGEYTQEQVEQLDLETFLLSCIDKIFFIGLLASFIGKFLIKGNIFGRIVTASAGAGLTTIFSYQHDVINYLPILAIISFALCYIMTYIKLTAGNRYLNNQDPSYKNDNNFFKGGGGKSGGGGASGRW